MKSFFAQFIQQINKWFDWFDRFIDIFQHIIDWLKMHNVNRSNQLLIGSLRTRDDPKMTLIEMRIIILCQLFNCLIPFQILNPGTLNIQENTMKFLTELKRFQPNNRLTVEGKKIHEQNISIIHRQQVQWSLVSENHACGITVEYRSHGANDQYKTSFQKQNVPIHKNVLHGQFESQCSGQLLITIDNKNGPTSQIVWYRIKSIGLSTCYLFHGIFNMQLGKYYQKTSQSISEIDFSKLLDIVFNFINKLLNGDISLRDMAELQPIFKDKNINIQEEVKKLYINRSNEQNNNQVNISTTDAQVPRIQPNEKEIEQVCEWLQIYQYYSHLNGIMECIEKFDLLPLDNEEAKIGHLKRLSGNHGRRRFQVLRDNLTAQFQLQELNNMILNSWIISYTLIEPFMFKTKNFDDFVLRLCSNNEFRRKLIELYQSGTVDIHLRRLTTQQSNFEIGYSIDRIQVGMKKVRDENDQSQQGFNQWAQQTIENIYHIFTQLELSGHPYYQLRDEHYEIHLQQTDSMLTDLRSYQNARIENAIQTRIQSLELIYNTLKTTYDIWIQNLKKYRHECSLLKLFSNRKIMILIILFRISNAQNPIRNRLLKKLFEFKDLDNKNEEEQKINYLFLFQEHHIVPSQIQIIYGKAGIGVKENFNQILPILSIIFSSTLEEITDENYQLSIAKEEELVARFLKAYDDRTIDRISVTTNDGIDIDVSFEPITNADQCCTYIYNCIRKYAPDLPKNKIYELSFTKFLYRRVRFFEKHYYRGNQTIKRLGSIAMQQMINEAKSLTQINFRDSHYPRVYLVYDPEFSLHLLHGDWNHVSSDLKSLLGTNDPLKSEYYAKKDYYAECLAWLINIKYETFMKIVHETKFILTENFAYKLFHVHERKLTKLALIIEGDTGVGKTFLLKFYSLLLNSKNTNDPFQGNIIPKIREHSNQFLLTIIKATIEK
ncbi:unnamed protein product [Didymodactylos carnosus]|uniref:Uncharacterized protein n=1 Tax=Didymodactylos carnosus TaxID=1234261 RepID=A0A8S2NF64_9BILA|nr:unnamed protein product [Didymodactylos carnosus]CAF3997996.1 unnamed protein product [Didymodactylos carnosus]